jgi:hypothetical protein
VARDACHAGHSPFWGTARRRSPNRGGPPGIRRHARVRQLALSLDTRQSINSWSRGGHSTASGHAQITARASAAESLSWNQQRRDPSVLSGVWPTLGSPIRAAVPGPSPRLARAHRRLRQPPLRPRRLTKASRRVTARDDRCVRLARAMLASPCSPAPSSSSRARAGCDVLEASHTAQRRAELRAAHARLRRGRLLRGAEDAAAQSDARRPVLRRWRASGRRHGRNFVPNFVPNSAQLTPARRTLSPHNPPRCRPNHPDWATHNPFDPGSNPGRPIRKACTPASFETRRIASCRTLSQLFRPEGVVGIEL